jgi:hypothetical protein
MGRYLGGLKAGFRFIVRKILRKQRIRPLKPNIYGFE